MKISIACDHAGLELKNKLIHSLADINWNDCGTFSPDSVDYPDFADKVCQSLTATTLKEKTSSDQDALSFSELGLLICGSGQGMAIRANRYKDIRAALCWNEDIARLSREHNNANILCLGARNSSPEEALKIVEIFLKTAFLKGRHAPRVEKLSTDTGC